RRDRSRAGWPPGRGVRRRADRRPGHEHERRGPGAAARAGRRDRPDAGHGHARSRRGEPRRPRRAPGRRPHRARGRALMLLLALQGIRNRKGPFAGAFVALVVASALVMACATLLASGLREHAPVERYAGAPVVVAGEQHVKTNVGTEAEDSVLLYERARV